MLGTPDHYATLGVTRTADQVVIHAAWRALLRKYHPDTNTDPLSTARARAINEAFAALGKPEDRRAYDRACGPAPADQRVVLREPPKAASAPRPRAGRVVIAIALLVALIPAAVLALLMLPATAPRMRQHIATLGAQSPLAAAIADRVDAFSPGLIVTRPPDRREIAAAEAR